MEDQMLKIDREDYLRYSFSLKPREVELRNFFSDWLPDQIIDCHVHTTLPMHVEWMDERTYSHMLSTFPSFSLEESALSQQFFYGDRSVRALRFAKTYRGVNHRRVNDYLLEESPERDRVALYGLPDDISYTNTMLRHPRVSALKMYYSYLSPPATEVYQYFPSEVLEEAQAMDIPIILHPPANVVKTWRQVTRLQADFPKLRIVIAHLGLSKLMVPGLREAYEAIARSENTYMDTSMNPSAEVVAAAIDVFGTERILFGTDEPLNLIRAAAYVHPELGERLITEYQYHWVDPQEYAAYSHLASDVIHAHWQQLEAIRGAIDLLHPNEKTAAKTAIFSRNAEHVFGFDRL
jgi:hypothetical protein